MFAKLKVTAFLALIFISTLSADINVFIKFSDQKNYFPASTIPILITITNNNPESYTFNLSDDRMYSIGFEAKTPSNITLEPSDRYTIAMSIAQPLAYRAITLLPGESYSFADDAARYILFDTAGIFLLQARFYPQLSLSRTSSSIISNTIILNIKPQLGPPALPAYANNLAIGAPKPISPDEVVRWTLNSRQSDLWEEFFLYIDVEALYTKDPDRALEYAHASDAQRQSDLVRYRANLETEKVDTDLSTKPDYYEILETRYSNDTGFVTVAESFANRQSRITKEYRYELSRRFGIWYITGWNVFIKGVQ